MDAYWLFFREKIRHTRKAMPELTQEEVEEVNLGREGETFVFEHLENDIQFTECSVKEGEIQPVQEFIAQFFQ